MKIVFRSVAALAMLLVLVLCPMQAKASSEELTPEILSQKLEALQIQFPDGRYWNHDLDVDNNPEGTTDIRVRYMDTVRANHHIVITLR